MSFVLGSFFFGVFLPLIAIVVAILAYNIARRRPSVTPSEERIAMLEEQVRGLLYRVWTLERGAAPAAPVPPVFQAVEASVLEPTVTEPPDVESADPVAAPSSAPSAGHVETVPVPGSPEPSSLAPPPSPPPVTGPPVTLDLEQRIGARWATWVGIVAILFAVSFFLKWSFDADLLGPTARVVVGVVAGLALLLTGLGLHRRHDVPYLSESLAGLGLGVLYLSLWAAHVLYASLGSATTFVAMLGVTVLGAVVAVASSRQITAVLVVLGGLLTPVLLRVERPDERNLLVYLL